MDDIEKQHPTSENLRLLYSWNTEYCADSIEWCPHELHDHFFVCANYDLVEDESLGKSDQQRDRFGCILLFSLSSEHGLKLHQNIKTEAVLDQKWCHCLVQGKILLGVVSAKNTLQIYKLINQELKLCTSFTLNNDENDEILLLSLDWNTGKYKTNEPQIICSDSKGNCHLFTLNIEIGLKHEQSFKGHEYEAWIAAFNYWDVNVMFTGGDDGLFLLYDKRVGLNSPAMKNTRSHEAGVTCIHSNVNREFIVPTGSYDSNIRFWDIRTLKSPKDTYKMPDTLWRLKWDPFKSTHLLAACMRGGVHIIDCKNEENVKIVESFYGHENIAYGVDWCYSEKLEMKYKNETNDFIIGSCSFYDKLLCVYKVNVDL